MVYKGGHNRNSPQLGGYNRNPPQAEEHNIVVNVKVEMQLRHQIIFSVAESAVKRNGTWWLQKITGERQNEHKKDITMQQAG